MLVLDHSVQYWESIENGTNILKTLQSLLKVSKCRNSNDALNITSSLQNEMDSILKEGEIEFWTPAHSITPSPGDVEFSEDDGSDDFYVTADEGYDVSILFKKKISTVL